MDSRTLNTALAAPKTDKYSHAEPEKTDVKVVGERARTEETDKCKQLADHIALTALRYT